MLENVFIDLLKQYSNDDILINKLWNEIVKAYSKQNRYYHTLQHLENLLSQLTDVKPQIKNWNAVLFALFYHDIVYNALKHNNEEKSAVFAIKKLGDCNVPAYIIDGCCAIILATKSHELSNDNDIDLFTDADLSILGADRNDYEAYCKNVRKEYSIYPDMMYNPGRKKVLQHFLNMNSIFKTACFFEKFEKNARENLQWEFERL